MSLTETEQAEVYDSSTNSRYRLDLALRWIAELREYRQTMETAMGAKCYAVEQLLDHFDADGNLKGDGKWRLNEIRNCCKEFDDACGVAAKLFHDTSEEGKNRE